MRGCPVCGIVPRSFWLFGGTKFWIHRNGEKICPGCDRWFSLEVKVESLGAPQMPETLAGGLAAIRELR